jgi:hypothetical protein
MENPEVPPAAGPAAPGTAEAVEVDVGGPGAKGPEFNAVDHGLTSTTRFPDRMRADIERRIAELKLVHQPANGHESSLIAIMARGAVQWDEATRLQVENRDRIMERAEYSWDVDRNEYIASLGRKLAADPEGVRAALLKTKQGADYLLRAWDGLLTVLAVNGTWD